MSGTSAGSSSDDEQPVQAKELEEYLNQTLAADSQGGSFAAETHHIETPRPSIVAGSSQLACSHPGMANMAKRSYWIFDRDGGLRTSLYVLINKPWFDQFILAVIAYNTILMMMTDFSKFDPETGDIVAKGSERNAVVIGSDVPLLVIFCIEFLIKSVAMGFWSGKDSYIRDNWNKLDFIVVVAGLLEIIPAFPNFSMLRCFRVLRPLRSISRLPKLKLQAKTGFFLNHF